MSSGRLLRGLAALAMSLTLYGCSGSDGNPGANGQNGTNGANGADGTNGTNGTDGTDLTTVAKAESCEICHAGAGAKHQAIYDDFTDGLVQATSNLEAEIVSVVSGQNEGAATFKSTLTFKLTQNGQPYVDPDDPATTGKNETLGRLRTKSYSATQYDPATQTFATAKAFSYSNPQHMGAGVYTVVNEAAPFAPEQSASTMVYVNFGDDRLVAKKDYNRIQLLDNTTRAVEVYGAIDYVSPAKVEGCELCHPTPYPKHGTIRAKVAGLPDFVSCKSCHFDDSDGSHKDWQLLAEDPAEYVRVTNLPLVNGEYALTEQQETRYAYKANLMNDVHMSHAMEFAYPQSMANCVTCHQGKLDAILDDPANLTVQTCKSCHPVTATALSKSNAPPLTGTGGVLPAIHTWSLYEPYTTTACILCHSTPGFFRSFHPGYDKQIYASEGVKYSDNITTAVSAAKFDKATNTLTVDFGVTGAATGAVIKPTVVVSLYGYSTKDFIVSGHGSQPDNSRNLEWADGGTRNNARLTVTAGTAAATWTAKADLSLWAGRLADGSVKKAEIAILPALGANQAAAADATNPQIAIAGATATVDLVGNAIVANQYGKKIVNVGKCNTCHDALATTPAFHPTNYGSAGVVGCRTCHTTLSGGSHLEMQSRSIDSYIHAIHSFQAFDPGDIDFSDPVAKMRYKHHIQSTYPNFTTLNCESCHESGTYEVPDQALSLPGLLSAADPNGKNGSWDRIIGGVPMYVSGPAARACGSCHRSEAIKADDAGSLASLIQHTASFGTMLETTSTTSAADLDAAIAEIFSIFK